MINNIKQVNIWESKQSDKCIFFSNVKELIQFMEEHNLSNFILYDKHNPNDEIKCEMDKYLPENICLNYTDKSHPITIIDYQKIDDRKNWHLYDILINPYSFEQYKNEFKDYYKIKIIEKINQNKPAIKIPSFVIDNELIDLLSSTDNLKYTTIDIINFTNEELYEFYISKLKKIELDIKINGENISSRYILKNYSRESLLKDTPLYIDADLTDEELDKFKYINENNKIILTPGDNFGEFSKIEENDERKYLEKLQRIFEVLQTHNRKYNITIYIENRELLMQSNLLNFSNINLTINNDFHNYSKDEFLKEEAQLEELVKDIKESTLSPYEKYLAVYNIVKQFKTYKEANKGNESKARYLKYILDLDNEYIVCVGFSTLLTTLLNKVGIPTFSNTLQVDSSYDNGFTMEDKPTELEGHMRNIVKIADDKYNIHGIYVADATWDNNMRLDFYNNSLITFDRKKESYRLESLENEDLLLDFHDLNDFSNKINYYLERKIRSFKEIEYSDKVIQAFMQIYEDILKMLLKLDYEKYSELYKKYNELIESNINEYNNGSLTLKDVEATFTNFLNEYANYIIPLSNNKIADDILYEAIANIKINLEEYTEEEAKEYITDVKIINDRKVNKYFPYKYNPNNSTPNYLEAKDDNNLNPGHSK